MIGTSSVRADLKAFQTFINANPRAPEYLSLFIDEHLKKGTKAVRLAFAVLIAAHPPQSLLDYS